MTEERRRLRSVSQLQSMASCGHAYYLERVLKAPQRPAAWFIQGNAVHAALEAYERSRRDLDAVEATSLFETAYDQEVEAELERVPDESLWMVGGRKKRATDIKSRRERGAQQVIDYIEANPAEGCRLMPIEIVPGEPAVEVGFLLDFDEVRVIGYIDLILEDTVTGQIFPRDIKTGNKVPADPYQMATYGLAITELTGRTVEWGDWWMCKDGKASQPIDLRPYSWDVVCKWYKTMNDMIDAGHFLGNPGDGCFTCTVKPYCSYVQAFPKPWPVVAPEQDFS